MPLTGARPALSWAVAVRIEAVAHLLWPYAASPGHAAGGRCAVRRLGLGAPMEHRCCRDSTDVPSVRLPARAWGRIRVAGRVRGAHWCTILMSAVMRLLMHPRCCQVTAPLARRCGRPP